MTAPGNDIRIQQLTVYPVKSLRGINVQEWPATPSGLQYDRYWMLVTANGKFVSQRQLPRMALIDTSLSEKALTFSARGHNSISLTLQAPANGTIFPATVWRDSCQVQEVSEDCSAWLNRVLQPPQPLRLVSMAEHYRRQHVDPHRFDSHTLFADAAPYLIANQSSLQKLNQALTNRGLQAVDIRRFRPNLVISGMPAFAEHQRSVLRHSASGFSFRLCDPCQRCIVTTIDPDTGVIAADQEPFNTLRAINPMPGKPAAPAFAVNASLPANASTTLCVGDRLF